MKLTALILGLFDVALVGWLGWMLAKRRWEESVKRHEWTGYVRGLNEGSSDLARFLSARDHTFYQGFAEECRQCGDASKVVGSAREEYWTCRKCGHRQPAPVAIEPQTAKRP